MQPRLLAISGSLTGTTYPVMKDRVRIGRDQANELCLTETVVSRRHCILDGSGSQYQLSDLDSRNGTFVNGIPVRRRVLEHGDTIRIGKAEFVFLTHEGEPVPEPRLGQSDHLPITELSTIRILSSAAQPGFGVEVGRMARDLAALFKISNAINSIRNLDLLQQSLLQLILEVVPAEYAAVILLPDGDEEKERICTWSRAGYSAPAMQIEDELVRRARWEGAPISAEASTESNATMNVICMPLIAVERTIGVLYLTAAAGSSSFREDHIHFLGMVSRVAAVTMENVLALDVLRTENRRLHDQLNPSRTLIGESEQIRRLEDFISRVASTDATVLIRGESGTGKELVAGAIHQQSQRRERPFVAINCAAIPESLIETELFGHEKGAFTGAAGSRKGKFETAHDGTLFLDEIGELAPAMQAKLLRVLQQREFDRVGGTQAVLFKARVLAATNKNLEAAITSGQFRQDLYYRLNVVSVTVPPLREHREDIPLLALYCAAKHAQNSNRPFKGITRAARTALMRYNWPGNVRELENAIEHAIVLGLTEEILPEDLPDSVLGNQSVGTSGSRYQDVLNETKKELIRSSMRAANNNVPAAALSLGIHPKYLHRLMRSLALREK